MFLPWPWPLLACLPPLAPLLLPPLPPQLLVFMEEIFLVSCKARFSCYEATRSITGLLKLFHMLGVASIACFAASIAEQLMPLSKFLTLFSKNFPLFSNNFPLSSLNSIFHLGLALSFDVCEGDLTFGVSWIEVSNKFLGFPLRVCFELSGCFYLHSSSSYFCLLTCIDWEMPHHEWLSLLASGVAYLPSNNGCSSVSALCMVLGLVVLCLP